jgi:hypothetical protein
MNSNIFPPSRNLETLKNLRRFLAGSGLVFISAFSAHASSWTGGSAAWSSNGNPGWNGTGVPNAAGAAADFTTNGNTGFTATLDAPVIIGSLSYGGSGNGSVTVALGSHSLTFNNNGLGAVISNASGGTSSRISLNSGSYVLADDLTISNENSNITGTQSILTGGSTVISGSGNLTLSNVSNSLVDGVISLGGTATFTGSVLIEKGAVIYSSAGNGLGNTSNVITLGSAGNGSASLVGTSSGTPPTLANNIVVAAGSGGTLLLGNNGTATVNATFSGGITLNGNVSLISMRPGGNDVRYTNVISGVGGVTTVGTGETQYGNGSTSITNTYGGNTTLTETSSFVLSDNAKMTFYIEGSGVNNKIIGAGTTVNGNVVSLEGDFIFDLSAASTTVGSSWMIVDVDNLNQTFGATFSVVDFLADGGGVLWTKDINGTSFYQFSEVTGVLSVVPEPGASALAGLGLTLLLFRRRRP